MDSIVGGVIPTISSRGGQGIPEAAQRGRSRGYPVVDFAPTVSSAPTTTWTPAKGLPVAGILGLPDRERQGEAVLLLEPIMMVEIGRRPICGRCAGRPLPSPGQILSTDAGRPPDPRSTPACPGPSCTLLDGSPCHSPNGRRHHRARFHGYARNTTREVAERGERALSGRRPAKRDNAVDQRPLIIGRRGGGLGSGRPPVTRAIYDLPVVDAVFIDQAPIIATCPTCRWTSATGQLRPPRRLRQRAAGPASYRVQAGRAWTNHYDTPRIPVPPRPSTPSPGTHPGGRILRLPRPARPLLRHQDLPWKCRKTSFIRRSSGTPPSGGAAWTT